MYENKITDRNKFYKGRDSLKLERQIENIQAINQIRIRKQTEILRKLRLVKLEKQPTAKYYTDGELFEN